MTIFNKVLVANRGDAARRIIRALHALGIRSAVVYSEADAHMPYLGEADEAYCIGDSRAQLSYLNQELLLKVIKKSGADAVHPGYGFLSENASFASHVQDIGVRFIGPSPRWIEKMSNKSTAREIMQNYGMPISAGSGILGNDLEEIKKEGQRIGFPVLVKPAGGGGGIGMLPASNAEELIKIVNDTKSMAFRAFSDDEVYLEKYLQNPRHIEFQILGDSYGDVCHFFERDCSVQRRHQKLIEESPAVSIDRGEISALAAQVAHILKELKYDNIGTVEMLRGDEGAYSFLEMNTRLQVEHAVTEEITGVDLVKAQIRTAGGEPSSSILPSPIEHQGHAIEVRVCAEDPVNFYPSPGKLSAFKIPEGRGIRVETGYAEGTSVSPYYDPLVAKVISHADTRSETISQLVEALNNFEISGIKTNIPFLIGMLSSEAYISGEINTGFVKNYLSTKE